MDWFNSEHAAFEDLSCTSCHTIHHNTQHKMTQNDKISLCVSCHQNQKAKMHFHAGRAGLTGLRTEYKPGLPIAGTNDAYALDANIQPTTHFVEGYGTDDWAAGMLTK